MTWKIGDAVRVKVGFIDEETDLDMSGWQGRITEFYPDVGTALIAFDSLTLKACPQPTSDGVRKKATVGMSTDLSSSGWKPLCPETPNPMSRR